VKEVSFPKINLTIFDSEMNWSKQSSTLCLWRYKATHRRWLMWTREWQVRVDSGWLMNYRHMSQLTILEIILYCFLFMVPWFCHFFSFFLDCHP
jgi:hypothetical protein